MAVDPEELGLEIEQQFEDSTPNLTRPVQRTVLIAEHFQIENEVVLGDYSGDALVIPYPDLEIGAEVELTPIDLQSEVEIQLVDPTYGTFDLVGGGTDFTPGISTVSVVASIAKTVSLADGTTGQSYAAPLPNTANFKDTSATFITDGVQAGDTVTIDLPSANAGTHAVTAVIDQNHLLLVGISADATYESYSITGSRNIAGSMLISYRARRNDLVGILRLIEQKQEIETVAGPADALNPMGLAAALHENAAPNVAFYVTALEDDTATSHAAVLDLLEDEDVYTLVPIQQNTETLDLVSTYKAHVLAESEPGNNRFRITLQSREVPELLTRVASHNVAVADVVVSGPGANELTLTDAGGNFLANGVSIGDLAKISASDVADLVANGPFLVKDVTATTLVLVDNAVTLLPSADITYSVTTQDFTLADQAAFMSDYAESIGERRVVNLVAGKGEVNTVFTGTTAVPSVFANAVLAALISTLPPQQGLSRTDMPGISDIANPTLGKFRRSDLNTIGGGGNLILVKPNDATAVSIRRQNTTDKSTADKSELSITKCVDWVSFAYLGGLEPFIGKFNVVPSFFSSAQTVIDSIRINLTNNELEGIGPILLSAEVIEFSPVEAVKGEVKLVIDIEVPFPVNKIRLTLIV